MSVHTLTFDWRLPYLHGPDRRWYPLVRVGVQFAGLPMLIGTALVDTGSPLTLFDGRLLLSAGLTLQALRDTGRDTVPLKGLTGGASRAYLHSASLYVGEAREYAKIETEIAFTDPQDQPLPFNLLGRRGFLEHVLLGLDEGASQGPLREPALYLRVLSRQTGAA